MQNDEYIINPDCPVLNSMMLTEEKKTNLNIMYKEQQILYSLSKNGEVALVASSLNISDEKNMIYDVSNDKISRVYDKEDGFPSIEEAIKAQINNSGFELSDFPNIDLRICVWHNHPNGNGISVADLTVLVDTCPLISEFYLDNVNILRLVLNKKLREKIMKSEEFRRVLRHDIIKQKKESTKAMEHKIDEIEKKYHDYFLKCFTEKFEAQKAGRAYINPTFDKAYSEFTERMKKIKEEFIIKDLPDGFDVKKIRKVKEKKGES
ncbi:MAG: hypothetical protein FWG91_12450 [Lachnospiraceae bacterium]|nr:hypothetical protein [Lachnospiraceae bacterium]